MSQMIPNMFTAWSLSDSEHRAGSCLGLLQKQVIQNLISEAASEKVALTYDPQNPLKFAQQEAELQGKIGVLQYLLAQSEYYETLATSTTSNGD